MAIRKQLPVTPIIFSCSKALSKITVNTLHTNTRLISLAETPATKEYPPLCPLLILCFIIENITGPTEMLSKRPSVMPLISGAIIIKILNNNKHENSAKKYKGMLFLYR